MNAYHQHAAKLRKKSAARLERWADECTRLEEHGVRCMTITTADVMTSIPVHVEAGSWAELLAVMPDDIDIDAHVAGDAISAVVEFGGFVYSVTAGMSEYPALAESLIPHLGNAERRAVGARNG